MFSEEKTAQIAAYFLRQRGGKMSYLKLMKLLYLADRESMARFDEPMTDDAWISMKLGPVLSNVLDLFQGSSLGGAWEKWISTAGGFDVRMARNIDDLEELDELSEADIDILEAVWVEHGHKTRWELVDFTHRHCAEWNDPMNSAKPISPQDVFVALGRDPDEANELAAELFQRRNNRQFLSRLR